MNNILFLLPKLHHFNSRISGFHRLKTHLIALFFPAPYLKQQVLVSMICGITFFHCSTKEIATSKISFCLSKLNCDGYLLSFFYMWDICAKITIFFYFYYEQSNSRFSHIFNISLSWALMFLYCPCVLLITNLCRAVCQLGADFYRDFFLQLNSLRRWICLWGSLTLGTVCHNVIELMSRAISLHFVS